MKFKVSITVGAWAAAALALVLFFPLFTATPYPGEPAGIAVQVSGEEPMPAMNAYLYRMAATALEKWDTWGTTTGRLGFLSLVCGVLSVGLMFRIGARLQALPSMETYHLRTMFVEGDELLLQRRRRRYYRNVAISRLPVVKWVAALTSAVVLMVSAPFAFAATRAHPAAFDTALFLLWLTLFLRFVRTGGRGALYAGALTLPLVILESPGVVWLTPLVGVVAAMSLAYRRQERPVAFGVAVTLVVAGTLAGLVGGAWWLYGQSEAHGMGLGGWWSCLWMVMRLTYQQMRGGLPVLGSLLVLLPLAPLVLMFAFRPRIYDPVSGNLLLVWGTVFVLLGLMVAQGPITPWYAFGATPLFVSPYVIAALWAGFLAARLTERAVFPAVYEERWIRSAAVALAVALAGAALFGAVRNGLRLGPSSHAPFLAFADAVIDEAGPKAVVIASTPLDDFIRQRARERGRPVEWLSPELGVNPLYRNLIAGRTADARLRALVQLEFVPYLVERFLGDPDFATRAVTLNQWELWPRVGQVARPLATLYYTAGKESTLRPLTVVPEGDVVDLAYQLTRVPPHLRGASDWARGHLSRMANDRGVELENADRQDDALRQYEYAVTIWPDNFSARLNRVEIWRKYEDPRAVSEQAFLKARSELEEELATPEAAMAKHGRIRDPLLLMYKGLVRATAGDAKAARMDMERAAEAGAGAEQIALISAELLADEGRLEQSEALLGNLMRQMPDSPQVKLALARTRLAQGRFEEVDRLLDPFIAPVQLGIQAMAMRASAAALRGDEAQADRLAEELLVLQPGHVGAWTLRASLALRRDDLAAARRALRNIPPRARQMVPGVRLAWAEVWLRENNLAEARMELEQAAADFPGHRPILHKLLLLDVAELRREQAHERITHLLQLDPRDATANYVLASLRAADGDYVQAEALLRFVLTLRRSPEAMNDLAWVLHKQGRNPEALPIALEAVKLAPEDVRAIDTCATIEWALNYKDAARRRIIEAWQAGRRSEALRAHATEWGFRLPEDGN